MWNEESDWPAESPCVWARLRKEPAAAALCSHWPCPHGSAVYTPPTAAERVWTIKKKSSTALWGRGSSAELLLLLALALLVRTLWCVIPPGCWYCFGRFVCQGLSGPALRSVPDCVPPFPPIKIAMRGGDTADPDLKGSTQDQCGVK